MNKSPLPRIVLAGVAVVSVWSLILCWGYFNRARELRELQLQVNLINFEQQRFFSLINEAGEYSKKNRAMESLLQSIGVKQASPPPAGSSKPPGQ